MEKDDLTEAIERGLAAVWPTPKERDEEYSGHIEAAVQCITAATAPLLEELHRLRAGQPPN